MGLLLMDGLDCYANATDVQKAGIVVENTANVTLQTAAGRFGGGALRISSTVYGIVVAIPFVAYTGTLIASASFWHPGTNAGDLIVFNNETGAAGAKLTHSAAGALTADAVTGDQTTGGTPFTASGWHRIEFKVVFDNSPNGSMVVKVDGTEVINSAAIDTQGAGTGIASVTFRCGSGGTNYAYIDDILICQDTGATALDDFVGDIKITTHTVTSDGGTVAWTASAGADFECVDETPSAANDDTDYISSSTAAQESRFNVSNLAATPDTIFAVQTRHRAKKTDAGARSIRGLMNSSAVEALGAEHGLTTEYRWYRGAMSATDPNTAAAWTASGVDALQTGVEVVV